MQKLGDVWRCGFRVMRTDRETDRQTESQLCQNCWPIFTVFVTSILGSKCKKNSASAIIEKGQNVFTWALMLSMTSRSVADRFKKKTNPCSLQSNFRHSEFLSVNLDRYCLLQVFNNIRSKDSAELPSCHLLLGGH